ncbi:TPA: hypothetical protein RUY93_003453 [Vibrio cholerae]|uniref:hypothetical protein n=1 Tax=Vibrio tarriae TaxID=2014742 RepID=UPI0012FD1212|nr:hypothetical protein [Vibrio tarriae]HDZ9134267.1 hypothetical protein [Vibrio cholerae]
MTKPIDKPQPLVDLNKKQELDRILTNTGGEVKSSVEGLQELRPTPPQPIKRS